jgi:hypothetical protein
VHHPLPGQERPGPVNQHEIFGKAVEMRITLCCLCDIVGEKVKLGEKRHASFQHSL